ncbi:MAG: DUF362 domain-containing protein [Ignavibacteria bacterium]|nr:DUF362 domain-containing protein [Ignavibacteria bacterium]
MDRRKFIKASLVTSGAVAFGGYASVYPFISSSFASPYDLVAIKGGEPEAMFDKAIASLGGMKNFVKKNQKVVIKPNIGWDVVPELAANTNPKLVARIIKHCFDAGAKDVYVFDHTCDNWNRCYTNSGIEKAVKDAGGKIVSGESESYYHQVDVKKGKRLTSSKVHELILESDVFINVPILKHHGGGKITAGMKNLMGVVWDRRYWHQNDLHQCIADFATFKKPDLNIVDAYLVMKRNGPRGVSKDDLLTLKSQIISTDIVAADAAAAKLFGIDLADVPYINYADELKAGRKDLSKLNINRIIM